MAKSLFLVASLLVLLAAAVSGARREALAGGYEAIKNVNDPYIQSLGKFAVEEHNRKAKDDLKFEKVKSGLVQIVDGTNYSLQVQAIDGTVSRLYSAAVYKDLKGNLKLNQFFAMTN
ncbi:cysteine proteinase inhibitor 1-like [Momordica charantia]|uniref:Cysteine proteinase inhibitor 1-like n=1 Tax=Momordica charantia TaxID=3673 RepID=A0A6J1CM53_MOMCH|nr:cysteine proteinase inhibitor 1-like [Momordica charantia]